MTKNILALPLDLSNDGSCGNDGEGVKTGTEGSGGIGQISRIISAHTGLPLGCYLERRMVKQMIFKLLYSDRMEKIYVRRPRYTEAELALLLNITAEELRLLQTSERFYTKMIRFINWSLVSLYCRTKFCDC